MHQRTVNRILNTYHPVYRPNNGDMTSQNVESSLLNHALGKTNRCLGAYRNRNQSSVFAPVCEYFEIAFVTLSVLELNTPFDLYK